VVAASSAVCLLLFHTLSTRSSPVPVVRAVGWDVLIFVAGMFIIATGVRNIGVTEQLASLIHGAGNGDIHQITYTTALTACVASALMNNHPTAVTMSMVINDMDLSALDAKLAAFAALIGGDLGPKMLPTGSLAAMLWFRILRSRGVEVSYMTYVKIGIPITLGALLLAVAALNLEIRLAGSP
jgi:arsenical pump membrane protein